MFDRNVSGDGGDTENIDDIRQGQGHEERQRIVLAGIAVEDDGKRFHSRTMT